jgi:hypothetical protein
VFYKLTYIQNNPNLLKVQVFSIVVGVAVLVIRCINGDRDHAFPVVAMQS